MARHHVAGLAALGFLAVFGASAAPAQGIYPYNRPTYTPPYGSQPALSPYLNLLRGGNPAANFFLGTLPEEERRTHYTQLRTAIQEVDAQRAANPNDAADISKPLNETGHPTVFGYYSSYYPLMNTVGGATAGRPAGGGARKP